MSHPKLLKKDVENWINLKQLFPKSKLDFRTGLTDYQYNKIKKAFNEIEAQGNIKDAVPIRKGAAQYAKDHNLPAWQKTIFLQGGQNKNADVEYKSGILEYKRGSVRTGFTKRARYQIETFSEDTVKKSIKSALKKKPKNYKTNITAAGRVMHSANNLSNDAAVRMGIEIFNKYSTMFENGETRHVAGSLDPETGEEVEVMAAHPSTWGMGLLFELKIKHPPKGKYVKRYK